MGDSYPSPATCRQPATEDHTVRHADFEFNGNAAPETSRPDLEVTMSAKTRSQILARQFELHTRLYNNVLDGIDDTAAGKRLNDAVNHVKWVAGHILSARWMMNKLAGVDDPNPWEDLFGHGKEIDGGADYPSLDVLRETFNSISPKILAALENVPDAVLDSPKPVDVPIADDTMAGMLAFLMHHEAYHIGQLGILRKYITSDAMSYK